MTTDTVGHRGIADTKRLPAEDAQEATLRRIGMPIAGALLLLFLLKPSVDLMWSFRVPLGDFTISPLFVMGLLVLIYFGIQVFRSRALIPHRALLFKIFIFLNFFSCAIAFSFGSTLTVAGAAEGLVKVIDGYVILMSAVLVASTQNISTLKRFVRFAAIGFSVAVFVNIIAIQLGYGGAKIGGGVLDYLRNRGLYYDPGVLANVSFYCIMFSVLWMHFDGKIRPLVLAYCGAAILASLFLINLSLSRMAILELLVFLAIYVWFCLSFIWRFVAAGLGAVIIAGSVTYALVDSERILVRFESDIAAIEKLLEEGPTTPTKTSQDPSLEELQALGNNRPTLWILAIETISEKSIVRQIFGDMETPGSHNDFIDVWGRNGMVGLVIYTTMLFSYLFTRLVLVRRREAGEEHVFHVAAFALITLYILYGLPFRPLLDTTVAWVTWVMVGFSVGLQARTLRLRSKAATLSSEQPAPLPGGEQKHARALLGRPAGVN